MASYVANIWFHNPTENNEDHLEEVLTDFMRSNGMPVQGAVVLRFYPGGDDTPWSRIP